MKEMLERAVSYLRGMWHRRWVGLAAAWVAAIIGVAIVYKVPEKYEAQARVYVDTESLLKPLLAGLAIQPNLDQQVALMSRTLISRPNVERLIRMADLDLGVRTGADREELTDQVIKTIRLNSVSTNLYTIGYRDPNPDQAKRVVQSLLNIFVESSLGDKRQDQQTAVKFLDEQIKRYEDALRAAENRLKDFKLKYMGVTESRDGGSNYFSRLSELRNNIEAAKLELQSYEQARDSYKRELAGEVPTYIGSSNDVETPITTPELDKRIEALKKEQDDLLRKYTDQHPDVQTARRLIAQLEEQRKEEIDARKKAVTKTAAAPNASDRNPVYQQLRISLAEAEASVSSARAKLAGYESQYQQLRAQAQLVPQVEAEFAQLNRDYDVQKKTYETLLARRESATMGKDVQDTGTTQFRVIDPPRVSPEPVFPNRLALLGIACALSIVIGLLAAFAASQIMPTFHDARVLRDISKRPILGMVSMIQGDNVRRRRRREGLLFAGGLSGLFAAFVGVITIALLVGRVVSRSCAAPAPTCRRAARRPRRPRRARARPRPRRSCAPWTPKRARCAQRRPWRSARCVPRSSPRP
jgi:polysaccharide chain length determinant protein (PEP-CTERM system associated)